MNSPACNRISRRSFITGGIATAMGASCLAGATTAAIASVPENWDLEADVVIVGYGGSGAAAIIDAARAGVQVVVLEKAPEQDAGGNFSAAGGTGILADPERLDDAFEFIKYQMPDTTSDDEIEAFVKETSELQSWLEELGIGTATWSEEGGGSMYGALETSSSFNGKMSLGGVGSGNYAALKEYIMTFDNVEIHYETPASRLIFDQDTKEVYGVAAIDPDGNPITVKAKRGVVLTCGGFENNHEMLTAYYPPMVPIFPCGTPYNTGDGIKMITEIGAKLRGFGSVEWGCHCCKPASEEIGVSCGLAWTYQGIWDNAIMVNDQGRRFVNESAPTVSSRTILRPLHDKSQLPELAFSMDTLRYTNLPMFLICDDVKVQTGAIFNNCDSKALDHWAHTHDWYTWSDDNQAEIEKDWITKADTLEELAEALGIDPQGLVDTVAAYNAACEAQNDEEFGRSVALTPVSTPPYYGCELGLGLINTQGGPVRNAQHQVIGNDGNPIPRLYAGGEFGSIYCWLYQGAGNVTECMVSHVAGANAAAEEPWC